MENMKAHAANSILKLFFRFFCFGVLFFSGAVLFAGMPDKLPDAGVAIPVLQEQSFPLTLRDASGAVLVLKTPPQRILPLSVGASEVLLAVVDPARIIGLSSFVDDPVVSNCADTARAVKNRASSNAEIIINLAPDLVIMDNWTKPELIKQLRQAHIPLYIFRNAANLDEQRQVVLNLAILVGAAAKGREIVAWMDARMAIVTKALRGLDPVKRLRIVDYSEFGTTSGRDTNFDDMANRAGLINASAVAGLEGWARLPRELLITLDPDLINLPGWFYDKKANVDIMKAQLRADSGLATLKAVKSARFVVVPYRHLTAVSQYMVLGIEDLARAAYPERFE